MAHSLKYALYLLAFSLIVSTCTDTNPSDFSVEQPQEIAVQDSINQLPTLISYVDTVGSDFKLAAGVSLSAYTNQDVMYHLINSNFNEITIGYGMKHGAVVQADGSFATDDVQDLIATARQTGMSVYGHTLVWHSNQNAEYLNSTIAPTLTESSGPSWDVISEATFETDDTSNFQTVNASTTYTADGEGANNEGRALVVTNPEVRDNDYGSQLFFIFSTVTEVGDQYRLTMDVKADDDATMATQAQAEPYAYLFYNFFGQISASDAWSTYQQEITIDDNRAGATTIAFNLGNTATSYYFDNIQVSKYNEEGGNVYVEKSDEEKRRIITEEMDRWISQMMETAAYVDAWDVVNEPMSDDAPHQLKTGIDQDVNADEFYWQDYLGKDYGVRAFELAEQYGDSNDLLFINDYNLEYDLEKCEGLIEYVQYIEENGGRVDGIGTQMHIDINSSRENIAEMFRMLAATGKIIKISELDIGLDGVMTQNATDNLYRQQAQMYQYVVETYFEYVPQDQRYGITAWSPLDSAEGSSWRAGEPIGLWNRNYDRKRAYAGFATGLRNMLGTQ